MVGIHTIEFGYESMQKLLALSNRPTAVLMTNYETSLGAVMAVNESSYDCPEDISMMGFDDLIMSHVVKPKLCMVVQPMREICEQAVELVLGQITAPGGTTADRTQYGNNAARGKLNQAVAGKITD